MQRFLVSLLVLIGSGLWSSQATALGFGKVDGMTTLGHPLNFMVWLRLASADTIDVSCVKADVSSGDRQLPSQLIRVFLDDAPGSAERALRVSTTVPIDEPIVTVNLTIGCPPNISRSYVVFADPPIGAALADVTELPQERNGSAVSAVVNAIPPGSAASASGIKLRRAPRSNVVNELPRRAQVAAAAPSASARQAAGKRVEPRPTRGAVLRLDPIEAESLVTPALQMATSLAQVPDAASASSAPRFIDPELEKRVREQERLKALEASLQTLRNESQATQKSMAEMQGRVQAAEAGRYANPLVYSLMLLIALLVLAMAWMFWLRHRDRHAAAWWTPPEEPQDAPPSLGLDAEPGLGPITRPGANPGAMTVAASSDFYIGDLVVSPAPAQPIAQTLPPLPAAPDSEVGAFEPRRPMSAEELIDLEQQAEFFVVLGQDDAAIDLLMGHVRSTGGVSPLPYLKLLEIYRRREEREPYDRIRERFNRRFNAYAPEWNVDPEAGLSLDGYPEVSQRLQGAWDRPSQAMGLLDTALFRRDAGPTFDVPAYRELLFLYGIARDLAERETGPEAVDLFLPLTDDELKIDSAPSKPNAPASPAAASAGESPRMSAPPAMDSLFSLDLDVSSDHAPMLSLEEPDPDFKRKTR